MSHANPLTGGPPGFDDARTQRQKARAAGLHPDYWYPVEYDRAVRRGQVIEARFWNEPIALYRGGDGRLFALENRCAHRQLPLSLGHVDGCRLTCMYHGWCYDTTGRLVGVPHPRAYGETLDRNALGLVPVKCETFGSFVFVALEPLRPTLREFLGEAAQWMEPAVRNLEAIGRASWIYDGNWKLWHENFRDNYHPQFAHGMVRDLTPDYAEDGSNHGLPPGHSLLRWPLKKPQFDRFDKRLKEVSGFDVNSMKALAGVRGAPPPTPWRHIVALFPNCDYQQPGEFAAGLQVCNPLTVDRTRVDIVYMAPIGEDAESRRARLQTAARTTGCWGEVSVDDCEAAERTTIGIKSRGTRYSNIGRGTAPGLVGDTLDEYSLREYYREYRHYLFDAALDTGQ